MPVLRLYVCDYGCNCDEKDGQVIGESCSGDEIGYGVDWQNEIPKSAENNDFRAQGCLSPSGKSRARARSRGQAYRP